MMNVYLLTGTPGSKSSAVEKIAKNLQEKGLKVGIGKVDDELVAIFSKKGAINSNRHELVDVIGERSQVEVKARWPEAYNSALEKAKANAPDIVVIVTGMEYYRSETYEFYCPIDVDTVKRSRPRGILTLIDDIYEIYYRLSQPGQVFDIRELVARKFRPGTGDRDPKDLRRLYKDALSITVNSLLRVLVWREKEIASAANLAGTLKCEHSVLAVKHPVETGVRLLLGPTSVEFSEVGLSYPVYISHPITRPRTDRDSSGQWPSFVKELDHVVNTLAAERARDCHIVPISPTAIDEFRIMNDGSLLQPALNPRWPFQQDKDKLLYSLPRTPNGMNAFADYEDFEHRGLSTIFDPPIDFKNRRVGLPLPDPEISGMLRALRDSIQLQMAGRDHLLVRQCPGFFLYRPLYDKFEFSGGVSSEIHTFDGIRKYYNTIPNAQRRAIAFIHDQSEIKGTFDRKGDKPFPDSVRQASAAITYEARQLQGNSPKTKRPSVPADQTVSIALQAEGDTESAAEKIHNEMYPIPDEGSIGFEQPLPWQTTKETLIRAIEAERAKALSGAIDGKMCHTYSEDAVRWPLIPVDDEADTYVDVVANLGQVALSRRTNAAERARAFFAKNASIRPTDGSSETSAGAISDVASIADKQPQ